MFMTFSFLAPCPTSGQVIYSENDELVTKESINELDNRIKSQKGVEVIFSKIKNSNHFFKNKEKDLTVEIEKYLKEKNCTNLIINYFSTYTRFFTTGCIWKRYWQF